MACADVRTVQVGGEMALMVGAAQFRAIDMPAVVVERRLNQCRTELAFIEDVARVFVEGI